MAPHGFFVAATGQNVGKTTTCLGLVAGLKKRHQSVGFIKPIGQEQVETSQKQIVDKDVVLFKTFFDLSDPYEEMSPVLLPRGFTRNYLDGKVRREDLVKKILQAYQRISKRSNLTIVEGTGHTGVGSIIDLNNAQVAALLNLSVILIAPGGLGSSFDELALNYTMCQRYGVRVAGVILNRVLEEKREMIVDYMTKALQRWNIPLLGCIPFNTFLSTPSMQDFELLFQTQLLTGSDHRMRHFRHIRLAASSIETYRAMIVPNQLIVTPAGRDDIILATLTHHWDMKIAHPKEDLQMGLILTGRQPPKESIIEQIRRADIPMLYVPLSSFITMKMINTFTTKILSTDLAKIREAIEVVERHIDFDALLKATHQA